MLSHRRHDSLIVDLPIRASRVGPRYVNNVGKDAEPFVWNAYIDNQLLGLLTRFADQEHVNRVFHIVEFRHDDLGVKFQFGPANPDFPAMIRKPLFVLDFDGYAQGSQDLREILANVERARAIPARTQRTQPLTLVR